MTFVGAPKKTCAKELEAVRRVTASENTSHECTHIVRVKERAISVTTNRHFETHAVPRFASSNTHAYPANLEKDPANLLVLFFSFLLV